VGASAADLGRTGPARSIVDLPLHRQATFWAFAALLVLGIVFYVWWGLSFGVWIDNGVYAVTITLVLFGLAGMWLLQPDPPITEPLPDRT
jgi:type VI protein secretion system component VasF